MRTAAARHDGLVGAQLGGACGLAGGDGASQIYDSFRVGRSKRCGALGARRINPNGVDLLFIAFAVAPTSSTVRSQPRVKIAPASPRSRHVTWTFWW